MSESHPQDETAAGFEEISNRRIGGDELSTIITCRAYAVAQWDDYTEVKRSANDGLAVCGQRFIGTPGEHDGLYWEGSEGGRPSPMASLVAEAREEGCPVGLAKSSDAPKQSPAGVYRADPRVLK